MCWALEDATMSWFKPLNLLLIMKSLPIQMSKSILGEEGFFLASSSIWGIVLSCVLAQPAPS